MALAAHTDPSTVSTLAPSLDPAVFRDAMSRLAGGVAIAACWDGPTPRGLLVSSLIALSTEPPRVLFCVRKASSSHDAFLRAGTVSVSILAEDDRDEAERFSTSHRAAERFASAAWRLRQGVEPPTYRNALIGLSGLVGQRLDAGTHSVLVLDVSESSIRAAAPLVYFDRRFRGLRDLAPHGIA